MNHDWYDNAACKGMSLDIFMDTSPPRRDWEQAASICELCSVAHECLDAAIKERDAWSFRGGQAPQERIHYHMVPDADIKSGASDSSAKRRAVRSMARLRAGWTPLVGRKCVRCGQEFQGANGSQIKCGKC